MFSINISLLIQLGFRCFGRYLTNRFIVSNTKERVFEWPSSFQATFSCLTFALPQSVTQSFFQSNICFWLLCVEAFFNGVDWMRRQITDFVKIDSNLSLSSPLPSWFNGSEMLVRYSPLCGERYTQGSNISALWPVHQGLCKQKH